MTGTDIAPGDLSIAICDRCGLQYKYKELRSDGNSPGMWVCQPCWDPIDPYRLPPRQPEPISLDHPRPDVLLGITTNYINTNLEPQTSTMFTATINTEDDDRLVF